MRFPEHQAQQGYTLVEVLMAMMVGSIVMLIAASMFMTATQQTKSSDRRYQANAAWFEMKSSMIKTLSHIEVAMFAPSTTYTIGPGGNYAALGPAVTGPKSFVRRITPADLTSESTGFLAARARSAVGTGLDVHQNSFTVRRIFVSPDGVATVQWIRAARCVPLVKQNLDENGKTIDPAAPATTAAFVFGVLDRAPFIYSDPGDPKHPIISCCPLNQPCRSKNAQEYLIRIFGFGFGPAGQIASVMELPWTMDPVLWGGGFIFTLNPSSQTASYSLQLFVQNDQCSTSGEVAGRCRALRPRLIADDLPTFAKYFTDFIRVKYSNLAGNVSSDLSSSGVISFSQ